MDGEEWEGEIKKIIGNIAGYTVAGIMVIIGVEQIIFEWIWGLFFSAFLFLLVSPYFGGCSFNANQHPTETPDYLLSGLFSPIQQLEREQGIALLGFALQNW